MTERQKRFCKDCGAIMAKDDKHKRCPACRKKLRTKLGIIAAITATITGVIYWIFSSNSESEDVDEELSDNVDASVLPEINIGSNQEEIKELDHKPGEKYWNKVTQAWEKDGKPYLYRVTYTDTRDNSTHIEEYSSVDNGYEDYEYYKKRWWTSNVTWKHIDPDGNSD